MNVNENESGQQAAENKVEVPDELEIVFRKPIQVGKETYERIVLQEPEARHIAAFEKAAPKIGNVDATVMMISAIAEVPKPVIDRMKSRDLTKAQEYLAHFLDQGTSQKTGETS